MGFQWIEAAQLLTDPFPALGEVAAGMGGVCLFSRHEAAEEFTGGGLGDRKLVGDDLQDGDASTRHARSKPAAIAAAARPSGFASATTAECDLCPDSPATHQLRHMS